MGAHIQAVAVDGPLIGQTIPLVTDGWYYHIEPTPGDVAAFTRWKYVAKEYDPACWVAVTVHKHTYRIGPDLDFYQSDARPTNYCGQLGGPRGDAFPAPSSQAGVEQSRAAHAAMTGAWTRDANPLNPLIDAILDGRFRIDGKDLGWDGDIKANTIAFNWHPAKPE